MAKNTSNTLFESIYARLRSDIIDGILLPDSKLRIEELREKYDISASPLREALNRLAGEGFVNIIGQRGFKVAPLSYDDMLDITRMRIQLECEALKESIEKGDDVWESNIIAAFHRLSKVDNYEFMESDFTEWEKRNDDFHQSLIAACTSAWLLRFRQILYEQHKRYRLISYLVHDDTRDIHKEHESLMNAVLARNVEQACDEIRIHIQRTGDSTRIKLEHSEDKSSEQKKAS